MNVTEMMEYRGFDMSQHRNFVPVQSIKESFDKITVEKNDEIAVVSYLMRSVRSLHSHIESVYETDQTNWTDKSKKFTIVLITTDEVAESVRDVSKVLFQTKDVFIQCIPIQRLLFNITKHSIVPVHERITEDEANKMKDAFFNTFHIDNFSKIPKILVTDPVAMFIGLRPKELCKITRNTVNAGERVVYRYCVF